MLIRAFSYNSVSKLMTFARDQPELEQPPTIPSPAEVIKNASTALLEAGWLSLELDFLRSKLEPGQRIRTCKRSVSHCRQADLHKGTIEELIDAPSWTMRRRGPGTSSSPRRTLGSRETGRNSDQC